MRRHWMTFHGRSPGNKLHEIRYSTPTLGFTVTRHVDEETERLVKVAIEVGKEQARAELRHALGIKES